MSQGNDGRYVSITIPAGTAALVGDLFRGKTDQDGRVVCSGTYDRIVGVDVKLTTGALVYGGKTAQTVSATGVDNHPNFNWYRSTYVRAVSGDLSATAVIAMR
jgi:hypothetical protein